MKWLILAIVIFAQQPVKAPQGQGTAEGKGTQVSKQADARENHGQASKAATSPPLSDDHHPSGEIQGAVPKANDDTEIQGKIETFTGLLVLVGFLQFFALIGQVVIYCRQAKIMERQAHEMKRQRGYMRLQWKAMGEQAKLMKEQSELMVEKERAKLRIELDEFRPIKDEHEIYWVKGYVSIYGSTEAFVERTEIYASIGATGIFNPLPEWSWGMHLPSVIRSGSEPSPFTVMVMAEDGPATTKELLPVREAKEFIYCMAKIEFADTYGHKWIFRLRRRFGFIWSEVQSPGIGGNWENSGPVTDNGEYRKPS